MATSCLHFLPALQRSSSSLITLSHVVTRPCGGWGQARAGQGGATLGTSPLMMKNSYLPPVGAVLSSRQGVWFLWKVEVEKERRGKEWRKEKESTSVFWLLSSLSNSYSGFKLAVILLACTVTVLKSSKFILFIGKRNLRLYRWQ